MINSLKGWESVSLGQLLIQIIGGGTPPKSNADYFRGTKPFMTVKDMHERYPTDTIDHISEEAIRSSATNVVPADTLIVATRMSLGKVVRPKFETAINQDLKGLFLANGIDTTFVEHWWRSNAGHIQSLGTGTTIKGIRLEDIRGLEIDLPPSAEQKRIADKLDAVLARVGACRDRLDRVPAILKRFRQSFLAAGTSGKLTEDWRAKFSAVSTANQYTSSPVGDPFAHTVIAPISWKEASLGDVCEFVGGSQPPKSTFIDQSGPDVVRLIQIRDYKSDKHITFIPKKLARRFCSKTDVMIGRYGPPLFQILRGLEGAYNVALMKAQPKTEALDLEYLYVLLRGDVLLKYVEAGSDRTAGQDGIRKELLFPYPVFLPSLEEQAEIVRRVESLFAFADRLEARYTAARAQVEKLTPSLLAKAFRGDLVPQDPGDEPANVLLERIRRQNCEDTTIKPKRGKKRTLA